MARARYRQLIYDDTFWEQVRFLEPDVKRIDELIEGVTWLIANYADECEIVEGNLRVAFTDPFPDAPPMRVFFTITDDNNCTLHWIERVEGEEEYEEW
jgi:hypothetical protein